MAICGYGGTAAGTFGGLYLVEYDFRSGVSFNLLVVGFSVVSLVFAALTTRPALRSLRLSVVAVFSGEVPDRGQLDQNPLFAKQLHRDLRDGVVTKGKLWSGISWVVSGEPAAWRLARPKVGGVPLDVSKLEQMSG